MDEKAIIIVGAGGHAGVLIDLICAAGQYTVKGIVDPGQKKGGIFFGFPVLGDDHILGSLFEKGVSYAGLGIGWIADNRKRVALYDRLKMESFYLPPLIHPKAVVADSSDISEGVQIFAGAVLQNGCKIGVDSIVNTGSIIEHDCCVGSHVHISPGSVICGGCKLADNTFVGAGSTIIQGVEIGMGAVIGAGAVVVRNVPAGSIVKGVPAG